MSRRIPGLRGKQPPRPTRLPHLHTLRTTPIPPTPPASADVSQGWRNWAGMLGNGPDPTLTLNRGRPVGDCFWAAFMRGLIIKALVLVNGSWVLRPGFKLPTSDQTVGLYFGWGRGNKPGVPAKTGPDRGTNCEAALQWLLEGGLIKRYGPVDHTNAAAVKQALIDHKGLIVGVALDEDAEEEFAEHKIWREIPAAIDPTVGGHAIYEFAYASKVTQYLTWGQEQAASESWDEHHVDELWWFQAPWEDDVEGYDFTRLDIALSLNRAPQPKLTQLALGGLRLHSAALRVRAAGSFLSRVIATLPAVLAEAAKLQSPALDTTVASGIIAVCVTLFANVHLTVAEVAGWLACTGTIAAAAQKVIGTGTQPKQQ